MIQERGQTIINDSNWFCRDKPSYGIIWTKDFRICLDCWIRWFGPESYSDIEWRDEIVQPEYNKHYVNSIMNRIV
jgi:hypothetical protein